ncbi:hypothetical protein [Synechococcus sp. CCY 0621]|uniref:hypothetical protein n=1 Tax=Synechococcus sp. CCY 0621 TaxID=2815603 RepID=UPI001C24054A|nr:hypothetical protein [Synechococcus sp. CCY 0621]
MPSTLQHDLLGLFAVAKNFPAIGPFLTLSQGVPERHVRRVIRITTVSSLLIRVGPMSWARRCCSSSGSA